jgi:hypothetical protein
MEEVWHGCWPALTVVPNYLATGILAGLLSLVVVVWSAAFVDRKRGGLVLMALSALMLPVGAGMIPAVLGLIAGAVATRIHEPLAWWRKRLTSPMLHRLAALWPWSLLAYFAWIPVQWIMGHFFNQFMLDQAFLFLSIEFGLLLLTIVTAIAGDVRSRSGPDQAFGAEDLS